MDDHNLNKIKNLKKNNVDLGICVNF
jgi:hypothetical protein